MIPWFCGAVFGVLWVQAQLAQALQRCGCEGAVPCHCACKAVRGLAFLKAAGVGHSSLWCHSREWLGAVELVLTRSRKWSCLLLELFTYVQLKTRVALLSLVAFAILKPFACITTFLCPPHNVCALSSPFSLLWHSYAQEMHCSLSICKGSVSFVIDPSMGSGLIGFVCASECGGIWASLGANL